MTMLWCNPDGCPAAICGGPHVVWVNDAGDELTTRTGEDPILPGYHLPGERTRGDSNPQHMAP